MSTWSCPARVCDFPTVWGVSTKPKHRTCTVIICPAWKEVTVTASARSEMCQICLFPCLDIRCRQISLIFIYPWIKLHEDSSELLVSGIHLTYNDILVVLCMRMKTHGNSPKFFACEMLSIKLLRKWSGHCLMHDEWVGLEIHTCVLHGSQGAGRRSM